MDHKKIRLIVERAIISGGERTQDLLLLADIYKPNNKSLSPFFILRAGIGTTLL